MPAGSDMITVEFIWIKHIISEFPEYLPYTQDQLKEWNFRKLSLLSSLLEKVRQLGVDQDIVKDFLTSRIDFKFIENLIISELSKEQLTKALQLTADSIQTLNGLTASNSAYFNEALKLVLFLEKETISLPPATEIAEFYQHATQAIVLKYNITVTIENKSLEFYHDFFNIIVVLKEKELMQDDRAKRFLHTLANKDNLNKEKIIIQQFQTEPNLDKESYLRILTNCETIELTRERNDLSILGTLFCVLLNKEKENAIFNSISNNSVLLLSKGLKIEYDWLNDLKKSHFIINYLSLAQGRNIKIETQANHNNVHTIINLLADLISLGMDFEHYLSQLQTDLSKVNTEDEAIKVFYRVAIKCLLERNQISIQESAITVVQAWQILVTLSEKGLLEQNVVQQAILLKKSTCLDALIQKVSLLAGQGKLNQQNIAEKLPAIVQSTGLEANILQPTRKQKTPPIRLAKFFKAQLEPKSRADQKYRNLIKQLGNNASSLNVAKAILADYIGCATTFVRSFSPAADQTKPVNYDYIPLAELNKKLTQATAAAKVPQSYRFHASLWVKGFSHHHHANAVEVELNNTQHGTVKALIQNLLGKIPNFSCKSELAERIAYICQQNNILLNFSIGEDNSKQASCFGISTPPARLQLKAH